MYRTILLGVAASLMLAACASGPKVRTQGDPSANLTTYKTFGYFDRVETDKAGYSTILTNRLKDSTRRELESRGYKYVDSNPQLLVNFNVNIQNRTDVQSTPTAGGYYGYRAGMYHGWAGYPQDVQTVHYQEGTVGVDLVDASKKQLVWQGVAEGRITKAVAENPGAAVDKAITEIFARYPTPAAGVQTAAEE
jgi:hypothetical protein